ncbi:hypothetical protein F0562_029939 [Nyssa sinensis]|uniref:Uncharacterized protein n=1 Tax=Nyssa sinensis TaxID=561372 RepID=A0A5J5AUM6_9ASTE|nr:hypothetical protein F0562_029939 [Nyssa sinensis]
MALPAPVQKAMVPVQRLSPAQMKERRDKGLCYNCDDKWAPGHRCKSAKLFIMECENSDEDDDIRSTPLAIEEGGSSSKQPSLDAQAQGPEPAISIHALAGSPNPRTMRIIGFIQGVQIVIMLDTGSTHNFVDPSIITKARLPIYHTTGLNVKVANGEAVRSEGLTKPETFQMQGIHFTAEFFVLTLGGCDVVLGVQWLKTLGPILWDFSRLSMAFTFNGSNITLQGLNPTAMSLMEGEEFGKAAKTAKRGMVLHLIEGPVFPSSNFDCNPQLQPLLDQFSSVFQEPTGLPPTMTHDHHIELLEGTKPINDQHPTSTPFPDPTIPNNIDVVQSHSGHRSVNLGRRLIPSLLQRPPVRSLPLCPVPNPRRRLRAHPPIPQPLPVRALCEPRRLLRALPRSGKEPRAEPLCPLPRYAGGGAGRAVGGPSVTPADLQPGSRWNWVQADGDEP